MFVKKSEWQIGTYDEGFSCAIPDGKLKRLIIDFMTDEEMIFHDYLELVDHLLHEKISQVSAGVT